MPDPAPTQPEALSEEGLREFERLHQSVWEKVEYVEAVNGPGSGTFGSAVVRECLEREATLLAELRRVRAEQERLQQIGWWGAPDRIYQPRLHRLSDEHKLIDPVPVFIRGSDA